MSREKLIECVMGPLAISLGLYIIYYKICMGTAIFDFKCYRIYIHARIKPIETLTNCILPILYVNDKCI